MQDSRPDPLETPPWLEQRQAMVWEPELLISGIVLFGLLQIPPGLDQLLAYLNDWGASIFFFSNMDEYLVAFLKTSVYLLIMGLIVNLLLRSVWVVMIGLSYTLPGGIDLQKLRLQPYYAQKFRRIPAYSEYISRMDKMASTVYSITFLLFMCLIGFSFFFLVFSGIFILFLQIPFFKKFIYPGSWINQIFNGTLTIIGGIYLLDFVTLGWLKRFRIYTIFYRPVYAIMSALTLAPVYRNIYYGLISRFNRWKIFAGLVIYILLVNMLTNWQMGDDSLMNMSVMYKKKKTTSTFEGHYRDKEPDKISNWLHIPSAQVSGPVLEFFVVHKAALEDSVLSVYTRNHHIADTSILASDSLTMDALSQFYRFKLNDTWLNPVPMTFMNFSRYNQKGLLGFLEIDKLQRGAYRLELWLNWQKPIKVASVQFYKVDQAAH